jgi:hypothetical protein
MKKLYPLGTQVRLKNNPEYALFFITGYSFPTAKYYYAYGMGHRESFSLLVDSVIAVDEMDELLTEEV